MGRLCTQLLASAIGNPRPVGGHGAREMKPFVSDPDDGGYYLSGSARRMDGRCHGEPLASVIMKLLLLGNPLGAC